MRICDQVVQLDSLAQWVGCISEEVGRDAVPGNFHDRHREEGATTESGLNRALRPDLGVIDAARKANERIQAAPIRCSYHLTQAKTGCECLL